MKTLLFFFFFFATAYGQQTGTGAITSSRKASDGDWKNWAVAASSALAAAVGVYIISVNSGASSHH